MDEHQSLIQVEGDPIAARPYILEGVKKNIMSVLIIAELLLLLSDINSNFNSLLDITDSSI